jgi:glutamate dehydrogenase (NAD(P)+)
MDMGTQRELNPLETSVVTGKPIVLGGSAGRREATGRGVLFVLREAAKRIGLDFKGARVVVQGFGNVGSVAADLLVRDGAIVVGVSDVQGGIANPGGIDIPALVKHVEEHKTVAGFPGAQPIDGQDLLELPCDILIPAALENQITLRNAARIQARIIAEAANGPTTPRADKILDKAGILVVPDILTNSGGVTVSYFEWVQDRQGFFWREEEVNERLEHIMVKSFRDVARMADEHQVSFRVAAFMLAIKRVVDVIMLRGVYA